MLFRYLFYYEHIQSVKVSMIMYMFVFIDITICVEDKILCVYDYFRYTVYKTRTSVTTESYSPNRMLVLPGTSGQMTSTPAGTSQQYPGPAVSEISSESGLTDV